MKVFNRERRRWALRRPVSILLATLMLATVLVGVGGTSPASADTRYSRELVETNCRYVTDYVQVVEYNSQGQPIYTYKPTLVWRCDRTYGYVPVWHMHWYTVACAVAPLFVCPRSLGHQ